MEQSRAARRPSIPREKGLPHRLLSYPFLGRTLTFRENTSDLPCIREVVERRCYERKRLGIRVETGERWLDLGANIGAFSALAVACGARVVAYEPEDENLGLLRLNVPEAEIRPAAVTTSREPRVPFFGPRNENDRYRWSVRPGSRRVGSWANVHAADLPAGPWAGVKFDVEGGEFPLLDEGLLPRSDKLAMEYHATKDRDLGRFRARVAFLRTRFRSVEYPPAVDRMGATYVGFYDFILFAAGAIP